MTDVTKNRDKYIGGSDAYRLVKGDWLSLYEEKLGLREPEDLSGKFNVQLGIHTEVFHLAWLRDHQDYPLHIDLSGFSYIRTDGGFPLRAHPDAMVGTGQPHYPVEVKHTNGFMNMSKMLETYAPQLHLQMYACQVDRCLFSFIAGNSEPEAVWIDEDPDYTKRMLDMCAAFWWHIEAKEPPTEGDVLEVAAPSLTVNELKPYDFEGNNQWADLAVDYTENKASAAKFERSKKELKKLVPDDASEVTGHGVVVKRSKSGSLLFK